LYHLAHDRNAGEFVSLADANVYFERALELDSGFSAPALFHADRFAHRLLEPGALIAGDTSGLDTETAYAQLREDFDLAARNAPDDGQRLIAEINQEFFAPHWYRLPGLIEQLKALVDAGTPLPAESVWLYEILTLTRDLDLLETIIRRRQQADPLNSFAWADLADLEIARGNAKSAAELVEKTSRQYGVTDSLRERQVVIALLAGDRPKAIRLLQTDFDFSGDYYYFEPFLAALQGDRDRALQLAAEIENKSKWPNQRLLPTYTELGERDRARDLVARVDAQRVGPVALALEIVVQGQLYRFDVDAAPNLRKRLEEARLDPAMYFDISD